MLTIAEAGVVSRLGRQMSQYAQGLRGASTSPGFEACSGGQSGSQVAAACAAQIDNVQGSLDAIAGRLEQFSDVCDSAEAEYGTSEDGIASAFDAMDDV